MKIDKKRYLLINQHLLVFLTVVVIGLLLSDCSDDFLEEKPLDFLSPAVVYTDQAGYESAITGLYEQARNTYFKEDGTKKYSLQLGTDIATVGEKGLADFMDYVTWQNPTQWFVEHYWSQMYREMIPRANTILHYGEKEGNMDWATEEEKNAILAEARFFRAWAYNFLANLYGGVPIVDRIYGEVKADFQRNTRQEVYQFAQEDLEYATQWLPDEPPFDGRIGKGAAYHLLTEVNINLGEYDKAIESASEVIGSGTYQLMTERFGNHTGEPGDVYSDLFATENQNRASGNLEGLFVIQFETRATPGGTADDVKWYGCSWLRAWGPKWWSLKDPDGNSGMLLNEDSLGRGVAWVRPTDYFNYTVWENSDGDIRNSEHNIRREFYYNDSSSAYYGQKVDISLIEVDTMEQFFPMIRKIEGEAEKEEGATYGRSFDDVYLMRLSETYLLRAEAYFLNGQAQNAADDINVVRARAKAPLISASDVDLDFILDERARELIIEESRRLTLSRMGKLVDRVRLYNWHSASSIQDYHELFPIPQSTIDANIDAVLEQNEGYN
jgi:hypothetical protein